MPRFCRRAGLDPIGAGIGRSVNPPSTHRCQFASIRRAGDRVQASPGALVCVQFVRVLQSETSNGQSR